MRRLLGIIFILMGYAFTRGAIRNQERKCFYYQNLKPQETVYIYNPEYPNYSTAEVHCKWMMSSPAGFNCRINCSEIVLTDSPSCSLDQLLISSRDDPLLRSPKIYCGTQSVVIQSTGRRIAVSLQIKHKGRLLCEVTAEEKNYSSRYARLGYD